MGAHHPNKAASLVVGKYLELTFYPQLVFTVFLIKAEQQQQQKFNPSSIQASFPICVNQCPEGLIHARCLCHRLSSVKASRPLFLVPPSWTLMFQHPPSHVTPEQVPTWRVFSMVVDIALAGFKLWCLKAIDENAKTDQICCGSFTISIAGWTLGSSV